MASGAAFDGDRPVHIETHISHLFLVGQRAFKMKRDVKLNFANLATLEKRHTACQREIILNRRTAPTLYLACLPITDDDGVLCLNGVGEPVEYVVEMQRFAQTDLFDRMANQGPLPRPILANLAEQIIAFHNEAEPRPNWGGEAPMRRNARDVHNNLRQFGADFLDPADIDRWGTAIDAEFARHGALLDERRDSGLVRQCHGDLHLGNICLFEGTPTLFDCIEFSDRLACIDVLYDLAFLVMDLQFHSLKAEASLVLNRYLSATRDYAGLSLMPAFLSLRAAIRAMIAAIDVANDILDDDTTRADAAAHLALALQLIEGGQNKPHLIAIGGLSGSGKSTLARQLTPALGPTTLQLGTDVIRKRLHGVTPETTLPKAAYSGEVSARTYGILFEDTATSLAAGQTVIADATFIRPQDRDMVERLARNANIAFTGIWLDISEDEAIIRVNARSGDPSDADAAVVTRQRAEPSGNISWHRLDATKDGLVADILDLARAQK